MASLTKSVKIAFRPDYALGTRVNIGRGAMRIRGVFVSVNPESDITLDIREEGGSTSSLSIDFKFGSREEDHLYMEIPGEGIKVNNPVISFENGGTGGRSVTLFYS